MFIYEKINYLWAAWRQIMYEKQIMFLWKKQIIFEKLMFPWKFEKTEKWRHPNKQVFFWRLHFLQKGDIY